MKQTKWRLGKYDIRPKYKCCTLIFAAERQGRNYTLDRSPFAGLRILTWLMKEATRSCECSDSSQSSTTNVAGLMWGYF